MVPLAVAGWVVQIDDLELVAAVEQIEVVVAVAVAFVEGHVEIHHHRYQVVVAFHVGLLAVAACCCYLVVVEILYRLLLLGVVALDSRSLYWGRCKTPTVIFFVCNALQRFETATPTPRW